MAVDGWGTSAVLEGGRAGRLLVYEEGSEGPMMARGLAGINPTSHERLEGKQKQRHSYTNLAKTPIANPVFLQHVYSRP